MPYDRWDAELYDIFSPLTTALARIQVCDYSTLDQLMKFITEYCNGDRATEACVHQFIVQARKVEDDEYEMHLRKMAEKRAGRVS